jgi:hypothetical protein
MQDATSAGPQAIAKKHNGRHYCYFEHNDAIGGVLRIPSRHLDVRYRKPVQNCVGMVTWFLCADVTFVALEGRYCNFVDRIFYQWLPNCLHASNDAMPEISCVSSFVEHFEFQY